jgi:small subunit ribosomal protein S6
MTDMQFVKNSIARIAGREILANNGVIRGITNWGVCQLANGARSKMGKTTHHAGHFFIMRFDASSQTQHTIRRLMGLEPRLLRCTVVKMGHKLGDISDVPGQAEEMAWTEDAQPRMAVEQEMQREDAIRRTGIGSSFAYRGV